ncbi:MAG: hypothetical protein U0Z53_27790 [Blastocatellia bacterium]
MTNEELNARFALVADHLGSVARSRDHHDEFLNRLEEGLDDLRTEVRISLNRTSANLDELRSIVRTAVRAGIRERRERHRAEENLRQQMIERDEALRQRLLEIEVQHRQRMEEIEQRNEQRLSRMGAAIERMTEAVMTFAERRNGQQH